MFFDHYPYTNFHNINLDWVLQAVKAWGQTVEANDRAFHDLKEANEDFKLYVTNYLRNLDITDEINAKLDNMLASGILTPYFAPYVKGYVDSWLASHVTPTSPALDSTLTLSGAAARADSTGKRLKDLAYVDALSTPEVIASLNRSQVLPGYRVQGIAYDYNGHYYVCGGSVDETGTGVIVKMTKPDFTDAEITEIPRLGHANDITYYNGYLYVCAVGGGDAPRWGIYKINVNDFTDKTLISNAPENTIGISYRQGDFWLLAPYRIYRTTDFTSYEVVVENTNDLLTAYGIPTEGRISQTLFRAAGYLIGWVCSFVFEDRHYGALTFFNSAGEAIAFKMFPAYHSEIQGAVYADMSIYLLADGNMVNVFRMDPRHLSYVQLKAGDDLNSFTGRGTLYSTGSNVSSELVNSPSAGEGFTVQVERLGVYNTIQTARTNSGRELYRVKSFSAGTWGEWIEPAAEVAQIKEDLSSYNSTDVLAPNATYADRTLNGITYTWDDARKTCTATGTPTGNTYTNMLVSQDGLPNGIKAGERYYVTFKTTDPNFVLFFLFYNNGSGAGTVQVTGNTYVTIPLDCDGIIVRLRVMGNINGEATASNIAILTAEPNSVLADKIAVNASFSTDFLKNYQGSNSTINGVSFNWQGGTCTVSGTATARANYNIIDSQQSLLDNMQIGDSFIFACDKTDAKIISQVAFYDSTGTLITSKVGTGIDVPFVIPDNTVGIIVRLYVNRDASVNGTVSNIKLVKLNSKKMSVPLIVSFVDDDTTSDELVTRYHDACCHNGIKGTYAVITKQMEDGKTQASKLLSYEDEGFGMCIHCYQQSGVAEWNATSRTEAVANACRANLAKGLRQMQEQGFLNFAHWITPGGHAEPDLKETAKMLGCKCLITTNDGRANLMQDINPWRIKRISLRYDDNGTSENSLTGVKNIIDKTVSEGSGWLIITTHFNDGWGSLTWDTTLDDNGYPIGYSRFNEAVQYALNAGLVPMTIPQAWTYYEDILTANIAEYNTANA